jgi:hypothetical protein
MDLDMSRDHEDSNVASEALAPKKPVAGAPVAAPKPAEAVIIETPKAAAIIEEKPAVEVVAPPPAPVEKASAAAAAKKPGNPNRRPLPPMGTGRRPGDEPLQRRRLRGMLRLIVEVLVGAIIGGGAAYGAMQYFHIPMDQLKLYVGAGAGGGALLFGFWGLLHFDHH